MKYILAAILAVICAFCTVALWFWGFTLVPPTQWVIGYAILAAIIILSHAIYKRLMGEQTLSQIKRGRKDIVKSY